MENDENTDVAGAGDGGSSADPGGSAHLPQAAQDGATEGGGEGVEMIVDSIELQKGDAFGHWRESFNQKIWTNNKKKQALEALIEADVRVLGGEDFAEIVTEFLNEEYSDDNLNENDTKQYLEDHAVYARPEKVENVGQDWIYILKRVLRYLDDEKPYFRPPKGDTQAILAYQGAHIQRDEFPDPFEAYFYSIIDKFADLDVRDGDEEDGASQQVGVEVFIGDPARGDPEEALTAYETWNYEPVHQRYERNQSEHYDEYAVIGIFQSERLDLTPTKTEMLENQLTYYITFVHAAAMYSRNASFDFDDTQKRLEESLTHPDIEMTDTKPGSKPLYDADASVRLEIDVTIEPNQNTIWFSSYMKEA
jgi:hypothetical protein